MSGSYAIIRALRGPVCLIALGLIFFLDHSGAFPLGRSWPVLLILVGALKLLEALMRPAYPPVPPQPYPSAPTTPYPPGPPAAPMGGGLQ